MHGPSSSNRTALTGSKLLLFPALILLVTGIWSAARGVGELAGWSPSRVAEALSVGGEERLENHVKNTREGAYPLVRELQRLLPDDAVLFGFYPDLADAQSDETLARHRTEAMTLLGELQLLLYPTNVQIMPARIALPDGAPRDRIFILDMNFPHREQLDLLLEPIIEHPAGTLLGVRGVEHSLLAEPSL